MNTMTATLTLFLLAGPLPGVKAQTQHIPNPLIDYPGFLEIAGEAHKLRRERRLTEDAFIAMAGQDDTVILDTRSLARYRQSHVAGAVHLNFSDLTKETLEQVIPSSETRVLIYCNNNFVNAPTPYPVKMARAALNIPTFITLYTYGYRNLYELGPVVDPSKAKLRFETGN